MAVITQYKGFNIQHTPNTKGFYDVNLKEGKNGNQRSYVSFSSLKKAKEAIDRDFYYTRPLGTKK